MAKAAAKILLAKREWTLQDEGTKYELDEVYSPAKLSIGQLIVHMFDVDKDYWLGTVTKKQRNSAWVTFSDGAQVRCSLKPRDYFQVWAFVQPADRPGTNGLLKRELAAVREELAASKKEAADDKEHYGEMVKHTL